MPPSRGPFWGEIEVISGGGHFSFGYLVAPLGRRLQVISSEKVHPSRALQSEHVGAPEPQLNTVTLRGFEKRI